MSILKTYWKYSKNPFYSIIFAIPLLAAYEIMIFTFNHSDIIGLRNGADVLFRQFFGIFNVYGFYVVGLVVLLALMMAYHFNFKGQKGPHFEPRFYILMILESILYAFIMYFGVIQIGRFLLLSGNGQTTRELIVLALGAGIYEEFIFRVILITGFLFFLKDILKLPEALAISLALIGAAFIFAIFHYIGPFGEAFELRTFALRFGAGLFLSLLYILRGYGITAYTHTLYDLIMIIG
ncbi:MAG: CPBP family glutamic-type intramembrane protease [Candidatus Marinimicrobia bacterium]|nr:CPBP family glutamic-type intramembrane protease [Candidatus Neomarinimicrobiota bacterium]MCK9482845.1 CPBP family glutamic-type intramembrane protease [Candidatus Neomarinimicrobiota bacterium]MCK9559817.1 CPBP family glutamic-type intramembrane protease [Candidatus Neomarinimicrobiota bacterium]MDD5062343.1 CPBP family glutamic-type intramembrane protease [Candidatus Neomarinimicrobiota bacterium]